MMLPKTRSQKAFNTVELIMSDCSFELVFVSLREH